MLEDVAPIDVLPTTLTDRVRRGNLSSETCPSRKILKNVTSQWGLLTLIALRDGKHRFGELRRKIGGVSEKMLTQSLRALESDGFINRTVHHTVPPHVEYTLTPLGSEATERVAALADWIELNFDKVMAARRMAKEEAPSFPGGCGRGMSGGGGVNRVMKRHTYDVKNITI